MAFLDCETEDVIGRHSNTILIGRVKAISGDDEHVASCAGAAIMAGWMRPSSTVRGFDRFSTKMNDRVRKKILKLKLVLGSLFHHLP
ncbi:hypothetical protein [Microvirga sp. KLBC 81]|uniref:hypothetical protein n=1 Tax=Microvirga sp. KLBC 81 TaxID=1862707 RepID=UPI001FDFD8CF